MRLKMITVVAALMCLVGCGPDGGENADAPANLGGLIWTTEIGVEESDSVVNVWPRVRTDQLTGGFIVADQREAQIRLYDENGGLIRAFGRSGDGPGEFTMPTAAVRLLDSRIIVADITGRFSVFDSTGDSLSFTFLLPFNRVYDLDVVDHNHVLVAAQLAAFPDSSLLHVVNVQTHEVENDFFDPWLGTPHLVTAMASGWASADVLDGMVAATFAVSDTLYLFRTTGARVAKIHIPSTRFRTPVAFPEAARENVLARNEWQESFDLVSHAFWMGSDRLVLQYQTTKDGDPMRSTIAMTTGGALLFEENATPKLFLASGDSMLFVNPNSITQDKWQWSRITP